MLEKYRKLAHDAHLNGDRVTEEYYLQFAEHYFRVIADQRQRQDQRQEEQRPRRDDRWQEGGDADREDGEYAAEYGEGDYTAYDQPHRREREDRPPRQEERDDKGGEKVAEKPRRAPRGSAEARGPEPRSPEPRGAESRGEEPAEDVSADDAGQASPYEPAENPFVRENRGTRGLRPRREDRKPRREASDARDTSEASDAAPQAVDAPHASDEGHLAFDPAVLPPAISASPAREDATAVPAEEAEAKPRRRTRRPRPPADDAGEALETVS
jgi:hypothetical protein